MGMLGPQNSEGNCRPERQRPVGTLAMEGGRTVRRGTPRLTETSRVSPGVDHGQPAGVLPEPDLCHHSAGLWPPARFLD